MSPGMAASRPEQHRKNVRTALVLASVALVFALGFVAKVVLFGA
jgi:hypothetical protein